MLKTCATCPHLQCQDLRSSKLYGCGMTDLVVPHRSDREGAVFWRVPLECQRPDGEVMRSSIQARKQDWETITHGA